MSDFTAIYCYRPGWREWEREPSKRAVAALAAFFGVEHVKACPSNGRFGYSEAVARYWNVPGDLIIIEQDMEPSIEMVLNLLDCKALACSQAYWMMPASTGHFGADLSGMKIGQEWAAHAAIGLCRLTERVRRQSAPPPPLFWGDVENYINKVAQQGAQEWHIHWPCVPHHHGLRSNRRVQQTGIFGQNNRRIDLSYADDADDRGIDLSQVNDTGHREHRHDLAPAGRVSAG